MQPLQYELRCPAAKHNSITRTATGARNLYAAITLRFAAPRAHSCSHYIAFCSIRWLTRMYLRTWQQNMTTIMQPLHCDLQPEIQQGHRTTHTWTSTRCRTPRRNRFDLETTAAAPAAYTSCSSSPAAATLHGKTQGFVPRLPPQRESHATFMQRFQSVLQHHAHTHIHAAIITMRLASTRCRTPWENRVRVETIQAAPASHRSCPASPAAATLHGKSTRFRAPASSPTRVPCNIHAAITMRFLAPRTHSWSHYNAISASTRCIAPLKNRLRVETIRTRLTQELPFIAGCSHFTRKNTRFRVPASSPTRVPCNIHAAFPMRFAAARTHACSHYNAIGIHTLQTTMEEPIMCWNDPSRTRLTQDVPFIAGCSHFTRINTRFRAPASSPTRVPCNLHAAITMRFLAPRTHSWSHYNAISASTRCIAPLKNRLRVETIRTRLTQELPFIAGCSHFTRKNARFRVPASSPTRVPCNIHAAITMRFAASLPSVTTLRHHHFLFSLPPFATYLSHHPSSSPLHHPSSPPLPLVTTDLSHHPSSSPLPFITTSLSHHPSFMWCIVVPSGPLSERTGKSVKLPVRARLCSFRSL